MGTYILRRLINAIPIILGISLIVFILVEMAPGDAVDVMIPPDAQMSNEERDALRRQLGLDKPAPLRYALWLGRTAQGQLGYSLTMRKPVTEMVMARLPATLALVGYALVFSIVLGVTLGIVAAVNQYSFIDHLATFISMAWLSIPNFFLGLITIYVFAVTFPIFPSFGLSSPGSEFDIWDRIHHLILPGTVLGLDLTAALARYVRSSVLEVLNTDYLRTARAKGLPERVVVLRHALPNALIPVITVIGLRLPLLFGGAVVIETLFQWPGMGGMALAAANGRDFPLLLALGMFTAGIVVISSLLADVAYAAVDPRIRYE